MPKHYAIFIDNRSHKSEFINAILKNEHPKFRSVSNKNSALFSPIALSYFINKEEAHHHKIVNSTSQSLHTMSSGEQKKVLLAHILSSKPKYIILDNPFDSLDKEFQKELKETLISTAKQINFIQLVSRKGDVLPFINEFAILNKGILKVVEKNTSAQSYKAAVFKENIPSPIKDITVSNEVLIRFDNVSISYEGKPILNEINWTIKKGEFWQLIGNNGSGKSTLLSMITGDNPKAYGQNIFLFGNKKGTGESVWELKQKLGYFSPNMTYKFNGRFTIEQMLISGLNDSIGLYTKASAIQKRKIKEWLLLLNLWPEKDTFFVDLSLGLQRLVMTTRAMVKHPPLLILDEPTTGMDDASAAMLISIVNKIAIETNTTILYVSHRNEPGLKPKNIFQLEMTLEGSIGLTKDV